ncbi:unnamed protein product [Ambrosiozyma monospora]|uniref:Unnamed protein product n=1 Tax=Ambrosiozyma monospora TaxID=43982 RepID=A0ACB5T6D8_AMBMO|nr:unnamed protein product [Ambrosiozyma monospora]
MTYELVLAISSFGINFPALRPKVVSIIEDFVSTFRKTRFSFSSYFSLIGLLQALTDKVSILTNDLFRNLLSVFDDKFYNGVEQAILSIGNLDVEILHTFQQYNSEFSSLFFMFLVGKLCTSFLCELIGGQPGESLIHCMISKGENIREFDAGEKDLLIYLFDISLRNIKYVNTSPDTITASSHARLSAVYLIKATSLEIISLGFLNGIVPIDEFKSYVNAYLDQISKFDNSSEVFEIVNSELLQSIFAAAAILSKTDTAVGYQLNRLFPSILSIPMLDPASVVMLTSSVIYSLKPLSQDEIVSSIYGLTNILSDPKDVHSDKTPENKSLQSERDSAILESRPIVCRNVVTAVGEITQEFHNESLNILVVTIISQKINKTADESNLILLEGLASFVNIMEKREFLIVLRNVYDILNNCKSQSELDRVIAVWVFLSEIIASDPKKKWLNVYLDN